MLALGHFDDGVKVGVSLAFANVQRRANGTLQVSVSSTWRLRFMATAAVGVGESAVGGEGEQLQL